MRKLGSRSAKPTDGGFLPASEDGEKVWFKREWRLIALLTIMIAAFVIRFIFAFGVSADNDFALSGGSGASSHAHIIESIITGSFASTDSALNYPYGSVNIFPPLMDFILAAIAWVVSAAGVSAGTAAAGTLAFSAPIFAALTCWPVYLIGRKMFNDEKTGLLAALFYAFFALMIMTTVFSNGTEYAFVGFLFAFMVYFLLKATEDSDKNQPNSFRDIFGNKASLINLLIVGILFAMIALSWNMFGIILLMLVFLMTAQVVVDRLRSKAIAPTVGIYSTVIALGIFISAPYYILAGLWDQIFSGPFIIALISIALAVFFCITAKRTWVIMIPVTLAIAAVALAALFFISGDLFSAVVGGNTLYTNSLMADLASTAARTSVSSMAAFFGWVTVWAPFLMFLYMAYKYRGNMDSKKHAFVMWWMIIMFTIGWFSTSYASIAGTGFAVASAASILLVIRTANLKEFFAEMRGNGIKHALRKMLKPIPLAAVIGIVALIVVPNAVYAVDASMPTNSESDGYFGGLGYTVMTDDINSVNKMWSEFSYVDKSGALTVWLGYATDAASKGGFDSVTDSFGGGTEAMSAILLANTSSAATAAMAVRLMLAGDIASFRSAIEGTGLSYSKIKGYIDDPSSAVEEVKGNIGTYGGIKQTVTEENALYLVLTNYITSTISESAVESMYGGICSVSGESIRYVSVDRSMLPVYYNDGSYFATVAFLGDNIIDGYGAPSSFYSYDTYSGYCVYTDAMYSTFFWKSLIGMSPAEAGFTSSVSYLNALALSDGTTKATPGYGMPDYKIAYWHVMYNPDSKATGSSDGWEDMNAFEAIERQNAQGGLINYVNGVVVMEYDPALSVPLSGTVSYVSGSGSTGAEGIQVSVYAKVDYDSSGATEYVKRSTAFTNAEGKYDISVPVGADYYVVFSSGTKTVATGSVIETRWNMTAATANLSIPATSLSGNVYVSLDPFKPYAQESYVVIEGNATGKKYQADVVGGNFTFNNILPDVYTLTVFTPSGTAINTASVAVNSGSNIGCSVNATSGTLTVTVTNDVGASVPDGTSVFARDNVTGAVYTATTESGQAKIYVVPSTYTVYATGSKVSVANPNSTVSNGGSSSAALTVYDARSITVSGAPAGSLVSVMSFGYVTSSALNTFSVPTSASGASGLYTAYAVSGNNVYTGASSGGSITLTGAPGYSIKGTVKDSEGEPLASGTVSFIMSNGATFIFSTDKDGGFDIRLPAGTYTMYIYGKSSASISTVTITGDTDMGGIKLSKSRDLTITFTYRTNMSSSTTRGMAFVDVKTITTIGDTEYEITVKTDASGKAVLTAPQGYKTEMTTPGFDNSRFHVENQSSTMSAGNSSSSNTWSVNASGTTGSYVKTVSVSNSIPVKLTLYSSSSTTYEGTNFSAVVPGQYTASIKGSTGYYYNGTVYIYPGQSGSLNIQATNVVKVELNASSSDAITVTPTDDEKGLYYVDPDNSHIYYLQRGKSFYFEAKAGEGEDETVAFASVSNISSPTTLNLSNKTAKAVIKGYVGVTADGTLTVTFGSVNITFPIEKGAFEMTVPAGMALQLNAKTSQVIGSTQYNYTGSTLMTASETVDGANIHFPSTTSSSSNMLDLSGSGFNFSGGHGSFTLSVKNTTSSNATYTVKAGPAWTLNKDYTINVNAGQTATVLIEGRYNPDKVGAGNEGLSVTVTSINGKSAGTYVLDSSAFSASGAPTTPVFVDVAGVEGAFVDAVSGYEYMYAITITNNDRYSKNAAISVPLIGGNWSVVYSDKDGGLIFPAAGTNSFKVNGYCSTVIYVKLMNRNATDTSVPSISVTVTMAGQTVGTSSTGVFVTGSTATINSMSAQPAEMESEEMKADGDNIFGERAPLPPLTFVLLAVVILLMIAMFWLGMKKGVFVRKR